MNWTTLYIQGKPGFDSELLKILEHSSVDFLSGSALESGVCLYWIDEKANLRDFKMAIGSKTIFQYRLRFYSSFEDMIHAQSDLTRTSTQSNFNVYA